MLLLLLLVSGRRHSDGGSLCMLRVCACMWRLSLNLRWYLRWWLIADERSTPRGKGHGAMVIHVLWLLVHELLLVVGRTSLLGSMGKEGVGILLLLLLLLHRGLKTTLGILLGVYLNTMPTHNYEWRVLSLSKAERVDLQLLMWTTLLKHLGALGMTSSSLRASMSYTRGKMNAAGVGTWHSQRRLLCTRRTLSSSSTTLNDSSTLLLLVVVFLRSHAHRDWHTHGVGSAAHHGCGDSCELMHHVGGMPVLLPAH